MGPRCSSAETQVCHRSYIIAATPSGGRREHFWGISCEKSRFNAKKSYFFQFRGERLDPPLHSPNELEDSFVEYIQSTSYFKPGSLDTDSLLPHSESEKLQYASIIERYEQYTSGTS